MKKLHILMLSAAFLFSGCKITAKQSLAEAIMPFPTLALGAAALYATSELLDVLDKTTDLGKTLDSKTPTDSEKNLGLEPQSFLHKWSLKTKDLGKAVFGVAVLPVSLSLAILTMYTAIAKGEF